MNNPNNNPHVQATIPLNLQEYARFWVEAGQGFRMNIRNCVKGSNEPCQFQINFNAEIAPLNLPFRLWVNASGDRKQYPVMVDADGYAYSIDEIYKSIFDAVSERVNVYIENNLEGESPDQLRIDMINWYLGEYKLSHLHYAIGYLAAIWTLSDIGTNAKYQPETKFKALEELPPNPDQIPQNELYIQSKIQSKRLLEEFMEPWAATFNSVYEDEGKIFHQDGSITN